MKSKISSTRALFIALGGMVALLALLVGAAFVYAKSRKSAYEKIEDTRDLKQRIKALGNEYVKGHSHAGLMIAVSTRSNTFYKGFAITETNAPSKESIYEIGSITKLFTAALLAKLEADGVVSSTNTVAQLLPNTVTMGAGFTNITLNHLATHTAGLPRLPENLLKQTKDPRNPYKEYSTNELYADLATVKLENSPGEKLGYSNFGYGLFGHLLELRSGKDYSAMVHDYLIEPLGMTSTWMEVPKEHAGRLMIPYDSKGIAVPYWEFQVMAPAGALKSTAEDLVRFGRASLDKDKPLHAILANTQEVRYRGLGGVVGWGWHSVITVEDLNFLWHNGGTGGFVSFLGLDPKNGNTVVVLSNSGDAMDMDGSVDKMGLELLKLATKISLE
ncbi:MAG: serine hydrolase domain-containing protein [Verrucomicrobiales bacterium]